MGQMYFNNDGKVTGAAVTSGEHFKHLPTPAPWELVECSIEQLPSEFASFERANDALQEAKDAGLVEKDYLIDKEGKKIELKK